MSKVKNKKTLHLLSKHTKVIQCLNNIGVVAQETEIALDEQYQAIINSMKETSCYTDIACFKLVINGREFKTDNFKETFYEISSDVKVLGKKVGALKLFYLNERPEADKDPSLNEEAYLLDSVAKWLGAITERKQTEEDLERSKTELQSILDSVPGYIFCRDKEGRHLFANRAIAEATGIPVEAWVGKTMHELSPNLAEIFGNDDEKVMVTDKPMRNIVERLETPQGKRWIQTDKIPYKDNNGKTVGIIGFAIDITEREQPEQMLRYHNAAFKSIQESIIACDANYIVIHCNKISERIYGIKASEVIGKNLSDLIGTAQTVEGENRDIFEELKANGCYKGERLYRTTNAEKWVNLSIQPIEHGGENHGWIVLTAEITEQKKIQEALHTKQQELKTILDSVPAYIFYKDSKGKHVFVNKALAKATGVSATNWYGRTVSEILPNNQISSHIEKQIRDDREVIVKNKPKRGIIEPLYTSQGTRWLVTDKVPKRDEDGKAVGVIGFSEDITMRLQAEEKVRRFQKRLRSLMFRLSSTEEHERRQLADGLHDEIGQTLALIRYRLQLLSELVASEECNRLLKEVINLTDDAIKGTRSLTFNLSPPILYKIGLEAALEWLVRQFNEKTSIQYSLEITGRVRPIEDGLRILVFRITQELLTNTLKHSKAEQVNISFYRGNGKLKLVITDDGVGFNASEIDANHQCFGIFSIREKLHDIGGQFILKAEVGKGTSVVIIIPSDMSTRSKKRKVHEH
ncbi:PAS domain-containing protein [Chloroflexota bacterium]